MSSDVKALSNMLKELDDQMAVCMHCGLCQAVCPVFGETLKEADVTRGKIILLENLAKELIKDPKKIKQCLDKCLLCGSCAANCPSGVKILDIFLKARAILTSYVGLSPLKKAIFRGMLSRPKMFNRLLDMASIIQNVAVKPENPVVHTASCTWLRPMLGDRHFPPLAKKSLHRTIGAMNTPAGSSHIKVAFFPGCMLDKIYPHIAETCLKVLRHHGVGVFMPEGLACCGIPALASGDTATHTSLTRMNLKAFLQEDFDYLITACATCTSTIKKVWPLMDQDFTLTEKEQISMISGKTMDISAFLVDVIGVTAPELPEHGGRSVTYHDPCHLKKSMGVTAQPRILIKANPHFKLTEMAEADRCCGCGGSFNLQHYDLSKRIGQQKRDHIVQSNAQIVATSCPACMLQIQDSLSRNNDPVKVKHVIEIYGEMIS
ncbi:(Fe-S)-binding protein [Desulfoplanes formicivorans]|uniref:Glycolate oxidase iron-sulfur subunit n=1 Tax=Desulfoplanes formicivorans TaxID=1592317 RepID=A0A194AF37_9BACT|nr:(Fe-S)-binding protein [Desulfoplanes formicivorans]GAU07810.1 (Fe-S)-binding protein [Desulfoplanes formicivorans]